MKLVLFCLAPFCLITGTLFAADYAAEGKLWWAHIQFLADDKLEGRNTGSEGYRTAARYVASQFEKAGLRVSEQPVKFETRTLVPAESSLALVKGFSTEPLELGKDATLTSRGRGEAFYNATTGTITAPLVFVGYGLNIPEANYNDLAGLDIKGKIAVYVNAQGPVDASGNIKSHYSSGVERWDALHKAGAIGIATIANPRVPIPELPPAGRGGRGATPQPNFTLADPDLREDSGMQVALTISRTGGPKFFAGSAHTFDEILKLAADNKPLPTFPLATSLIAKTTVTTGALEAPNIVGILPGSDPKLKDEYVVFSAHLDHLGPGRPGAMDNASGVASLLEVARLFKESGYKPKRSIVFVTVCGEEKGELGSRYFASRPPVPAKQIVADINLDMFLPLYNLKVLEVQGLAESTLGDQIRAAAKAEGVDIQADREPEQNRFTRSDQYSFIRQGIPALAFKFGYEFGSPEEKIRTEWVKNIYHKAGDNLTQPVNAAAAARFDRVIFGLLQRIADAPARPRWLPNSFFRRFATQTP
jgi:hypothetical protein